MALRAALHAARAPRLQPISPPPQHGGLFLAVGVARGLVLGHAQSGTEFSAVLPKFYL